MLEGKKIVLGVCGGIAAYKVVEVASRLKKLGAEVDVIMTENAAKFVTPLTFRSITHRQVAVDMFEEPKSWDIQHISYAQKADLVLVAPATANIIGKVAGGIADDLLSTTIMATKAPVVFVPAMNHNMFENPILQNNISKLSQLGYSFLEPDSGEMACGTSGKGRLPEPCDIVEKVLEILNVSRDMLGRRVMITAGPTREAIDPVRYISNHSSGKMGYAIASSAARRGASVVLISGPVDIECPKGVERICVETANEMYNSSMQKYSESDIIILVAAVADYRCAKIEENKIKKTGDSLTLELVKNPDIAKELGKVKGERVLVGFSAETQELLSNAKLKLEQKNLDMIVANDVTLQGAGFGSDTNIVKILHRDGSMIELPKMAKSQVADNILHQVMKYIDANKLRNK